MHAQPKSLCPLPNEGFNQTNLKCLCQMCLTNLAVAKIYNIWDIIWQCS